MTTAAVVLLFFLYGARMATSEVWDGLKNWRLQGGMLASTYLLFPVLLACAVRWGIGRVAVPADVSGGGSGIGWP